MSGFTGFPEDAWLFLGDLATHNNATWFNASKARYQESVALPCAALVAAMAPKLKALHPDLQAEAKVGRSLFRINRDTRFAADKTPYKTHLDFLFWVECGLAPRESPALIMRLTAASTLVGAGRMGVRDTALRRYRESLLSAPQIGGIVADLLAAGGELSEPDRAQVPAGQPADHPNAHLLRRDGFHVTRTLPHPSEISGKDFPHWCEIEFARSRPLLEWFRATA